MVVTEHTPIPQNELDLFASLKDVEVVFDVGARADIEYLRLKPNASFHLFEPNPRFFNQLTRRVGDRKNVYINNYGLGDVAGEMGYDNHLQSFLGGEADVTATDRILPIKTLDWYIDINKITRLDFLKIDTEGYDYKVLLGGRKAIDMAKYIQYEHWDELQQFHDLLEQDFAMEYIGDRNVLCTRR